MTGLRHRLGQRRRSSTGKDDHYTRPRAGAWAGPRQRPRRERLRRRRSTTCATWPTIRRPRSRIARKLCQRFVSDDPPPTLVDALAPPTWRTTPRSSRCCGSCSARPRVRGLARRRRSAGRCEDIVATLRMLGIKAGRRRGNDGIQGLYWMIESLGQRAAGVAAAQRLPRRRRRRGARRAARSAGGTRTCRWPRTGGRTSSRRRRCK